MEQALQTILKATQAIQDLTQDTVRNNTRLDKVAASLNMMICDKPNQASHMRSYNVNIEGMLPPKKYY